MNEKQHILIVEDSETQALSLAYKLEQQGFDVAIVPSAEKALDTLSEYTPNLLVVDYHLPGIHGDELCRRIRMNINTRGIPILMLTSKSAEKAELHSLESGADDYVPKSANDDILLLRIQALLRKSNTESAIVQADQFHFHNAKLLLVDDSLTYLEFLASELTQEGYVITKAQNGEDALVQVTQNEFDCVLVDLVMPDMDGIEVCSKLSELRRRMDNPIVVLMLTANESKEYMTRGLEAGADDFVGKSSDLAVLKARIRALLRRKFFQEENQQILQELKEKELETIKARTEKEAAEAKAALAEALAETNKELEATNHKLRETQSQLVQSEKMASIGQLTAGIAHEINNPLAYVINNLFSVKKWIRQVRTNHELPPDATQKLEKSTSRLNGMDEGLQRVKDLVLKLRTFSRLDEGEFKTVDIEESIEAALTFLQHKTKDRIQIVKNYGEEKMLQCYAGELNQVILNILANAVQAIQNAGQITITTQTQNDQFMICIRDTGCGIPEHIRNRIFDPFFTTKAIGEGTGLGLSISYGIIQKHQGHLDVTSEEGKGTEFCIRIPTQLQGDAR